MDDSSKRVIGSATHDTAAEERREAIHMWEEHYYDTELKERINGLVFEYGHPGLTLHDAESLALDLWQKILLTKPS